MLWKYFSLFPLASHEPALVLALGAKVKKQNQRSKRNERKRKLDLNPKRRKIIGNLLRGDIQFSVDSQPLPRALVFVCTEKCGAPSDVEKLQRMKLQILHARYSSP
jgi:hypothetical protein